MNFLISLHNALFDALERASGVILPTLARFAFAAVLAIYFWKSALTKMGDGILGLILPSDGAYVQIFPKAMEAVSYDSSQLGLFHWFVAFAGMWAELLLPALLILGLLTRLSAIAMIGFVIVQSLTDVYAHGQNDPKSLGAWFDKDPASLIMDQRLLWLTLLIILVVKGAGPLSLDRFLGRLS